MAKLYFRYGTVGSAKTMNLLAVAHNYAFQEKKAVLIKPKIDDRFGKDSIRSRAGLEMTADLLVGPLTNLKEESFENVQCILVDEAQFLSEYVIDQLRDITLTCNVPVICYGLRTDFRQQLFPGSRRLFELADSIEEIKTTCAFCNKKGIFNLKYVDNNAVTTGKMIDLGSDDKYKPACPRCYKQKIGDRSR